MSHLYIGSDVKLGDGDYTLVDGAAWLTVGPFSIRIRRWEGHETGEIGIPLVDIRVYALGREEEDSIKELEVFDFELEDSNAYRAKDD